MPKFEKFAARAAASSLPGLTVNIMHAMHIYMHMIELIYACVCSFVCSTSGLRRDLHLQLYRGCRKVLGLGSGHASRKER